MTRRDIPNLISLLRVLLVLPVVWLMLDRRYTEALLLFAVAGMSDALDGYLAKRYGWVSRLGALLDPLADKLLLVSAYLVLGWQALIPVWLVAAVIARDLVIVVGGVFYHFRIERFEAAPSIISKLNTFLQIMLVLAVVSGQGVVSLPDGLLHALLYGVAATTLASGLDYVWEWGRRAWRVARERSHG